MRFTLLAYLLLSVCTTLPMNNQQTDAGAYRDHNNDSDSDVSSDAPNSEARHADQPIGPEWFVETSDGSGNERSLNESDPEDKEATADIDAQQALAEAATKDIEALALGERTQAPTQVVVEYFDFLAREKSTQTERPEYPQAFFSPDVLSHLVNEINDEHTSIKAACYVFTHNGVVQALLKAQRERRVSTTIFVDRGYKSNICEGIRSLILQEIPVYFAASRAIMHHKFFIFENNRNHQKLLWTGSYNFTGNAEEKNWENALVVADGPVIQRYEEEFERLMLFKKTISVQDASPEKKRSDASLQLNGYATPQRQGASLPLPPPQT